MKLIKVISLIYLFIPLLIISCVKNKSQNIDIIQSTTKMFVAGDPPVVFKSYGATYNYFSEGTFVFFKVNYKE